MDIEQYLKRIDFKGPVKPTIDVLRALHRQHMLMVPFENLDIHLGIPIILDNRLFYRKIVEENRGGYCYELNGCFSWLLKTIGFKVSTLSARVGQKNGGFTPEFDHMTLLVSAEERWLVDVGFGDSFTTPKPIDAKDSESDHGYSYRISERNKMRILSRRGKSNNSLQILYAFSLRPRKLSEFDARNRYQQTSPKSHFRQQRLVSRLTRTGRVTLTDTKLITTRNRERKVRKVTGREEFARLLAKHFQIRIEETNHTTQALPASFFPRPDDVVRDWVDVRSFE